MTLYREPNSVGSVDRRPVCVVFFAGGCLEHENTRTLPSIFSKCNRDQVLPGGHAIPPAWHIAKVSAYVSTETMLQRS